MCDFCGKYNFQRVCLDFMWDAPSIALTSGATRNVRPDMRRFRFCPLCGRELSDDDFKNKN